MPDHEDPQHPKVTDLREARERKHKDAKAEALWNWLQHVLTLAPEDPEWSEEIPTLAAIGIADTLTRCERHLGRVADSFDRFDELEGLRLFQRAVLSLYIDHLDSEGHLKSGSFDTFTTRLHTLMVKHVSNRRST